MMELIGWTGSILFAICGIPQALDSFKRGNSEGLTWAFLLMWFWGEGLTLIYIIPKLDYPLLFNYSCNLICLLIILRYKIKPRNMS